ncbi:MAG: formylglycine-generating enzyme family protein [Planctomycetota bacterium]
MKKISIFIGVCLIILVASCGNFTFIPEVKIDDPITEAIKSKLPREISGMVFVGANQQGYNEYQHEATSMVFVFIPGGTFKMGSNESEYEKPVHEVTVSDFLISKYETTQGVWQEIMCNNPSYFKKGDDYPVETVSWEDCYEFCKKTGLKLPTEAEWEYACRAGTTTKYYWGDEDDGDYLWNYKNSDNTTHTVGEKKPNGYGLYDMSGNVWEWCLDWYHRNYFEAIAEHKPNQDKITTRENPQGPFHGRYRVLRGGSWDYCRNNCRSACRAFDEPKYRSVCMGFRCAASIK